MEPMPSGQPAEHKHGPLLDKILAWTAGAVLLGVLLWLAAPVLLLFFAAVLVAVFLRGISDWVGEKTALSETWALAVVILCLAAVGSGLLWLIAPSVAAQVDLLTERLPEAVSEWREILERYGWGRWLVAQVGFAGGLLGDGERLLARAGGVFSSVLSAIVYFLLVLIVGLYLAAEAGRYREGVIRLLPRHRRERAREVMRVAGQTLRGWLLGQMVSMTFLGVFAYLGLSLLGIPLALTLAVFTALLTFIPNLGPFISVVPPVLLAMAEGPVLALYVILFYLGLQNLEGYLITPMVQRRVIRLPPALLIPAQVLLAVLLGALGLLLAAPLTALALVLVKMLYMEDVLGETVELPGYRSKG